MMDSSEEIETLSRLDGFGLWKFPPSTKGQESLVWISTLEEGIFLTLIPSDLSEIMREVLKLYPMLGETFYSQNTTYVNHH